MVAKFFGAMGIQTQFRASRQSFANALTANALMERAVVVLDAGDGNSYRSGTKWLDTGTGGYAWMDYTRSVHEARGAALTGATNTTFALFFARLRFNGGDGVEQTILINSDITVKIVRTASNNLYVAWTNGAGWTQAIEQGTSGVTINAALGWFTVLIAADTNHAAASRVGRIYVNDVTRGGALVDTGSSAFSIDVASSTNWYIGRTAATTNTLNASVRHLWFRTTASYFNLDTTANRRKFITAQNEVMPLGSNGSAPTAVQPLIYRKVV